MNSGYDVAAPSRRKLAPHQYGRKWHMLDAHLRRLHGDGVPPEEIATALGVTASAVRQRAVKIGLRFPPRKRPVYAPILPPDVRQLTAEAVANDPAAGPPPRVGRAAWPLHLAAYVAHVELGFSTRSVAALIGRDRKLVSYAARCIESRREEDPALDALIDRLSDDARRLAA